MSPAIDTYNPGAGTLLTRGVQTATAINAAAENDTDILCQGDSTLYIQVQMTGAAVPDLDVSVYPFEADNTTVGKAKLQPDQVTGPTLSGGKLYFTGRYDVMAIEKVRIAITNNNAGAQTIDRASWRLQ